MAHPQADELNQSDPQKFALGVTEMLVRVVGTEKERFCGVGSGVDFSATYALMRKLVGQKKQENQADRQRETEKKVHEDRERESKGKGSCLHPFPVGEPCSVCEMSLYSFSQRLHLTKCEWISSPCKAPCLEHI